MKALKQCILSYTPPGFKQTIDIPFPAKGLSVCEKCKKNFKTRELCRHRYGHTDLPTGLTYICITLDSSCTNPDGSITDKLLTAQLIPRQPYLLKKESNGSLPICSVCKEKNYTRAYCRNKLSHKMLPWNTNYVVLSANYTRKFDDTGFDQIDSHAEKRRRSFHYKNNKDNLDFINQGTEGKNSILNIRNAPSRTFLAQVRVDLNKVEWLEHDHNFICESGRYDENIQSYKSKGSIPPSSDHHSYARSNSPPKFAGNTTWQPMNSRNDYHDRDNQYSAPYPDERSVWSQTNVQPDPSYSESWDMRRYNSMNKRDYDYFSSYPYSNRPGTEASTASTDYTPEHNTKLPPQLHQKQKGNSDNYSHSDSSRIENMHNRPYGSYGHYDVDNNWSNMSSYHSAWEHQPERTNSHQLPSNVYSSNQEGHNFSLLHGNEGKNLESSASHTHIPYGIEHNVKVSSQLEIIRRDIDDNNSQFDSHPVENVQSGAYSTYAQFQTNSNSSNQASKYSPWEYQSDRTNFQEYSSNVYSSNEDRTQHGFHNDGNQPSNSNP